MVEVKGYYLNTIESFIKHIGGPVLTSLQQAGSASRKCITGFESYTIQPMYAVGLDADGNLVISEADYGADQNSDCYQNVIVASGAQYFAVVGLVVENGRWRKKVFVLDENENIKEVHNGVALVVIEDTSTGSKYAMPVGIAPVVAIALVIGGSAVVYKVFDYLKARQDKEALKIQHDTIKTLVEYARQHPEHARVIWNAIGAYPAAAAEGDAAGWLDKLAQIAKWTVPIVAVMITVMKWKVLLEVLKGFKERL